MHAKNIQCIIQVAFKQKKFETIQAIETSEDFPIKELFWKPLRLISSMLFIGIFLIITDILQSRYNYVFKNMFQITSFERFYHEAEN